MVRNAGNKRRTIIKHIRIRRIALLNRALERLVLLPLLYEVFLVFNRLATSTMLKLHLMCLPFCEPFHSDLG